MGECEERSRCIGVDVHTALFVDEHNCFRTLTLVAPYIDGEAESVGYKWTSSEDLRAGENGLRAAY